MTAHWKQTNEDALRAFLLEPLLGALRVPCDRGRWIQGMMGGRST